MNRLIIIGNLTRDPEQRILDDGTSCAVFTVAVNRRVAKGAHPQTDYVRVTAWRQLGENVMKYLYKGKKVEVDGPVRAHAYTDQAGTARAALEMTADNLEFLSPKGQAEAAPAEEAPDELTETDDDDLPF